MLCKENKNDSVTGQELLKIHKKYDIIALTAGRLHKVSMEEGLL